VDSRRNAADNCRAVLAEKMDGAFRKALGVYENRGAYTHFVGSNGMRSWITFALAVAFSVTLNACSDLNANRTRDAYITTDGGNARAGRDDIRKYGCNACHTISGVPGAHGLVGPPLDGIGSRQYIAGEVPNTAAT